MEKHFFCKAIEALPGVMVISTNDKTYYSQLIATGGKMLCCPELFNGFSHPQDMPIPLSQSVPYVVLLHSPLDKPDQNAHLTTDICERYETRLYR
ncbi:MAG: hypothetical protein E6713_05980 [Sporomusaceae bacterium]|nr:hypothetical protein [Sporomusaceae bacterium]